MMDTYQYIIIGGGMTAAAAVKGIREVDPNGSIAMLSAEKQPPYQRPPLTKKLWQGKPEDSIWIDIPQDNLTWLGGCRATGLDPDKKQVQDETGKIYGYQKLLLATGGSPRRLPFGPEEILYFRSVDDYRTLRSWTGKGARIGVIGGGFIGSELAAALAANGEKVVMVFPETGIGFRVYPQDLSKFVTEYYRQQGVEVYAETEIQAIEQRGAALVMRSKSGQEIEVDHIVAGIGIQPNTDLAQSAGISVRAAEDGGGIIVDENLRTNRPGIYAAGDVASFFNPALGRRMRVEHEDNANTMGAAVGRNMAGQETAYHHLPFFYSDLFDLGYEAVGELDPGLETYADWQEPFHKGVIYYLKNRKVRGVLLWNTWDQVDAARALIAAGNDYTPAELKGQLPKKEEG